MGWQALGSPMNFPPGLGDLGVYGQGGDQGIFGYSGLGCGVKGTSDTGYGVGGYSESQWGVVGNSQSGDGVHGWSATGNGVHGLSDSGFAGYFEGFVTVTQNLSANNLTLGGNINKSGTCNFKIDHPVDPANKYLYHCAVESPDMKNIYDGVVALDAEGAAVVELPAWFEALNQDFRYQLTAIGAPGPNLYVAQEISGRRFTISGGAAGMRVSWQVTGIRHDVYAEAHRSPVEQDKAETERGFYLHPELFGQPPGKSIEWARRPAPRAAKTVESGVGPSGMDMCGKGIIEAQTPGRHCPVGETAQQVP